MASNIIEYSVFELSTALKRTVEGAFGLVRVRGEISGFKRAASGHVYLALKDDKAVIDGVCWRGTAGKLAFQPEDGLEVIATGKLTTYPGRSKYQIVIEHMEPAGAGALMALFEERKKSLEGEGLFADERKRPLPFLPEVIGIVTSPTGAVIRDILHRLLERFPRHVLVWPVIVQGEGAAEQIARAIAGFAHVTPRPDLVIVARGGGSIEDLWAFNEEVAARAAAASPIPLISAVGHETDTTLIDFVSDRRAPTPTAAAEMAVPVRSELKAGLQAIGERKIGAIDRLVRHWRQEVTGLARGLPEPRHLLSLASQRLDDLGERLGLRTPERLTVERAERLSQRHVRLQELTEAHVGLAGERYRHLARRLTLDGIVQRLEQARPALKRSQERLAGAGDANLQKLSSRLGTSAKLLESLSHKRTLERGFAIVHRPGDDALVASRLAAETEPALSIEFHDGRIDVKRVGSQKRKSGADKRPPQQEVLL